MSEVTTYLKDVLQGNRLRNLCSPDLRIGEQLMLLPTITRPTWGAPGSLLHLIFSVVLRGLCF